MKISFNSINLFSYKRNIPKPQYNISFCAVKKSQFDGLDLNLIEKFKPPIEKFKSRFALGPWFEKKYNLILKKDYKGRKPETKIQRKLMINQWHDYMTKENLLYTIPQRLLILSGVTQGLKPDEDRLPPVLNGGALADTIEEIDKKVKDKPKVLFSFLKIYNKKLDEIYKSENNDFKLNGMKWMVIPSKKHDPENFEKNVERLKFYSSKYWCTKSSAAEPYLKKGDFHLLFVDGKIKLAIRFDGDLIKEIRTEYNNFCVPFELLDEFENHIAKHKHKFSKKAKKQYLESKKTVLALNKTKTAVEEALKTKDLIKIFNALGIKAKKDKDGFLTISHYSYEANRNPYSISFFGIDEKELLKKVKRITGDASFFKSTITKLDTIQYIGGNAGFYCDIKNLGSLEEVGGDLTLSNSPIKSLGNLKKVGGTANFSETKYLKDLGNLEYVGDMLRVDNSNVKTLGKLKKIEGNLNLRYGNVKNLGNIEEIGMFANLADSKIESLGNLKKVGGNLWLQNTNIRDIGQLEEIGGTVNCKDTPYLSQNNKDTLEKISNAAKKFGIRDFNRDYIMKKLEKDWLFYSKVFELFTEEELHKSGIWDNAPQEEKDAYFQNKIYKAKKAKYESMSFEEKMKLREHPKWVNGSCEDIIDLVEL